MRSDGERRLQSAILVSQAWQDPYWDQPSSPINLIAKLRTSAMEGEIGVAQLEEIARTKSPRRAAETGRNADDFVRRVTRLAFDRTLVVDEKVRIQILCALSGVRIPTASAILSWVFPEVWPVIDRRAWCALADFQLVDPKRASRLTPGDWAEYVDLVNSVSKATSWPPQKIDRYLYAYAVANGLGGTA